MTTAVRRQFTAQEKVEVLRLHFLEKKAISELCEQFKLNPAVFYRWQKEFFENGAAAFERAAKGPDRTTQKLQEDLAQLHAKLVRKDEIIADVVEEQVRLKKELGLG